MSAPPTYPTSPTKRSRRTKAEIEDLKASLHRIVERDRPMSVLRVFYQAVVAGLIEKTEAAYRNVVSRLLVQMRRDGDLSYLWISDSTRWVRRPRAYAGPEAFVEEVLAGYRRAFWAEEPVYCEVWCEKEALAGTIVDVTAEFDVPLMVSRGFSSDSYLYEAAENPQKQARRELDKFKAKQKGLIQRLEEATRRGKHADIARAEQELDALDDPPEVAR